MVDTERAEDTQQADDTGHTADWAARELGKPVANATELSGKFTFELQTPALSAASFTAAAKALGLEVTPQRLEQQVLVTEKAAP